MLQSALVSDPNSTVPFYVAGAMLQNRAVTKRDICPSSESLSSLPLDQAVIEVPLETIATISQRSQPLSRLDAMCTWCPVAHFRLGHQCILLFKRKNKTEFLTSTTRVSSKDLTEHAITSPICH